MVPEDVLYPSGSPVPRLEGPRPPELPAPEKGVYGISVAAELSGAATQSLRLWERHGLLAPSRTEGGTRRYSPEDLIRIRRITTLVAAGVNIAGIAFILELEDDNTALRAAVYDQQRRHSDTDR
ncbi:Putative transcriptional regulator, MerR family [Mycobacteroides abscessus subsp. abscessus]|uniref:Transcriptional regulator, MerR family n=6 Tax=Mycobacteroides abscessus TaxID=36809 RepID=B1MET8_MYCA9|nr:MerR family transcriptional regulator [Mycobacteroides abscessus]AIC71621.1 MerR family transcriptional regulator [Mycobacteroides abscessus subsp. massiliense str. GO 06]EIT95087.1 transcriptional regulator HspR [Mycobacteroides abscessus 4S-0726-RA]CAM63544.1 Putative transcriptional regulator, MerR family [Mycobacteroides abscessus ATCC 19977]AGM30099.1 transcriptional regulator HspR [Mycobacteroides abscessus subsp. bolletii 50594]ARQ65662.1 MerR family DNA-binding transcriptional regul